MYSAEEVEHASGVIGRFEFMRRLRLVSMELWVGLSFSEASGKFQ